MVSPKTEEPPRRVVIACQGGGSHTAFTAGVLRRLLVEDELKRYRVVGLSGTSGGAICALMAWHGLMHGDRASARRMLDGFWAANSASAPHERMMNALMVWGAQLGDHVALPAVSPYDNPFSDVGLDIFRNMLRDQLDFDAIEVQPEDSEPMLLLGAVDVLSGEFRTFNSKRERITADQVLASAAIPNLFRSIHVGEGTYWDGLFSQNPPIRELLDEAPDEVWVIQINPTEITREPRTVSEIADRRNELSGNLSLFQELYFIEKIDRMLERGLLEPGGRYRRIVVRVIELTRSRLSVRLGMASKLNRDPAFISELIAHGEERAEEFLGALSLEDALARADGPAIRAYFDDAATLDAEPPFPEAGPHAGVEKIVAYVKRHFGKDVELDLTRKQIAGNGVTWTVLTQGANGGPSQRGRARAVFRDDRVVSLHLGPAGPIR